MTAVIPYARQSISQADIDAVVEVLRSDWLTQGPDIERFEASVSAFCRVPHAIAVSNGTAALHLACLALDLGPGDVAWTSCNTFAASANCARYCGAEVDFVDIDPATCNMSVEALAGKLEGAARQGRLPKVVIPVHFGGLPCDMPSIRELAERYGFKVLEDASHAIGAEYGAHKVGACEHSDIAVFSFHPVKLLTTGEGGLLTTRDSRLARRLARLRTHGITRDPAEWCGESDGPWYYEQVELGYNYRMTDLQAALGASQLRRLGEFLQRRRDLARRYAQILAPLPLNAQASPPGLRSAWHLYVVQLDLDRAGATRRQVVERMRARGVMVNVHYIPVYRLPYYRALGFVPQAFPNGERYYERCLSLPMYFGLSDAQQDDVGAALAASLRGDATERASTA